MTKTAVMVALAVLVSAAGCAMRVKGVVTDAESGSPIAGAVVSSACYPRSAVTDGMGQYDLKTKRKTCTFSFGAPGYHTRMVTIPGGSTNPVHDVSLRRSYKAWGRQLGPHATEEDEPALDQPPR